jgi:hypothetical protein
MPGVFVIQGWNAAAGVVVEEVVVAESAEAARARALARDLTLINVRPYAPVAQPAQSQGQSAGRWTPADERRPSEPRPLRG